MVVWPKTEEVNITIIYIDQNRKITRYDCLGLVNFAQASNAQ